MFGVQEVTVLLNAGEKMVVKIYRLLGGIVGLLFVFIGPLLSLTTDNSVPWIILEILSSIILGIIFLIYAWKGRSPVKGFLRFLLD